jgi:hypothetical protein
MSNRAAHPVEIQLSADFILNGGHALDK